MINPKRKINTAKMPRTSTGKECEMKKPGEGKYEVEKVELAQLDTAMEIKLEAFRYSPEAVVVRNHVR